MSLNSPSTQAKPASELSLWMIRTFSPLHTLMYRRGIARKMGQMQTVLLTTTGRKSRHLHTVPVGAVREGDGWVVIASNNGASAHPGWWLNMLANPNVTLQVNDEVIKARMQEITNPADRERIWNTAVAMVKSYANYAKRTSRVIPLGWLRPA